MEHEDLIRKHLGVNTPDWIVANVQKAIDEALRKHAVSSSVCPCDNLPDGEIAISSKALQKPYGDLGQTDC
jgi:hypothetical protein